MEPEVLAELVEKHEPEVPVTSGLTCLLLLLRRVLLRPLLVLLGRPVLLLLVLLGWLEARTGVAAGSNWRASSLTLHLPVLALLVERAVNRVVEVIEAEVEQHVLDVVLKTLHEVLLLLAVIRDLGRGVASELKETITILHDRHSPLKWKKKDV